MVEIPDKTIILSKIKIKKLKIELFYLCVVVLQVHKKLGCSNSIGKLQNVQMFVKNHENGSQPEVNSLHQKWFHIAQTWEDSAPNPNKEV